MEGIKFIGVFSGGILLMLLITFGMYGFCDGRRTFELLGSRCEKIARCGDNSMANRETCSCVDSCLIEGTCCRDYKPENIRLLRYRGHALCEAGKYVVNQCPPGVNDPKLDSLCSGSYDRDLFNVLRRRYDFRLSLWPVMSDELGVTYRNMFCALCWEDYNIKFWTIDKKCVVSLVETEMVGNATIKRIANESECVQMYSTENIGITPLKCQNRRDHLIEKCHDRWREPISKQKCANNGTAIVTSRTSNKSYKNAYCAKCNFVRLRTAGFTCAYPRRSAYIQFNTPNNETSISFLYDVNSKRFNCSHIDEIYDPFSNNCRTLVCPFGFRLVDRRCLPIDGDDDAPCALVTFNASEFVVMRNKSAKLLKTEAIFPPQNYTIVNGTLKLCGGRAKTIFEKFTFSSEDPRQTLLWNICSVISVVALLVNFIMYTCFPTLRNLRGQCLMCLDASLFTAQILLIVGIGWTRQRLTCKIFAILTHYFFLAAFFWLSCLPVNATRAFKHRVAPSPTKNLSVFLKYNAYAWLTPAALVSLGVLLDYYEATVTHFSPSYGNGHVCWMANAMGHVFLFMIPVGFILFINISCFGLCVYRICSEHKHSNETFAKNGRIEICMYFTLTLLMGTAWILVYVANAVDSIIIWYFYVIFNTSQGFFILVAFTCKNDVFAMVTGRQKRQQSAPCNSAENSPVSDRPIETNTTALPETPNNVKNDDKTDWTES
ncbi:uncharacterized protein LOC141907214 [Tubulanus polymorphus]|uniref:uncharacterized protein LOC141907214 n=1 Tax=Tubulanus polymorphus TaxID=672921 RepID=UPI003DA4CE73